MAHPPIIILGYSEAAMLLRGASPPKLSAIISIHGQREYAVEANVPHRLDLTFDDVECELPGDIRAIQRAFARRRNAEGYGLIERAPIASDVKAIIDFAESTQDAESAVLIHCGGGISRAPAVALICLAHWSRPGTEVVCVREVLTLRNAAVPHIGLVRFADELLERNGKLIDAVAAIKK